MRLATHRSLLAVSLTVFVVPGVARGEDLFSEIAVESVFGATKNAEPSGSTAISATAAATEGRVTGAGQLSELLRNAGLEPKRLNGKTVEITISYGQWTIPTTLFAAVDRSQIDITMNLAGLSKTTQGDAVKLLQLLSASQNNGVYFAFETDSQKIQVRQTLSARGPSGAKLRRLLTEMAEFAVSREAAWYDSATSDTKVAVAIPLTGSWIATAGDGEAFAIKLTAEGQFNLAHVKGGQTTTSKGSVNRTNDQLQLIGDGGITITGTLSNTTPTSFELTLAGGKNLTFKKAVAPGK